MDGSITQYETYQCNNSHIGEKITTPLKFVFFIYIYVCIDALAES
jgi:hypothetical protein